MVRKRLVNAKISAGLVFLFMFSLVLPAVNPYDRVAAAESVVLAGDNSYINEYSGEPVHGIIRDTISHGEVSAVTPSVSIASADAEVTSLDELEAVVSEYMHNWESEFVVRFIADTDGLPESIQIMIDDILHDNHYLKYSLAGWNMNMLGVVGDVNLTFTFNFRTTKAQEKQVDEKVKSVLAEIITPDLNEHFIVKEIHDYVVANTAYDQTMTRYTAYHALIEGTAVCHGYALLAYRMLTDAGVEAMIVEGIAGEPGDTEDHAWNLVRIEGIWYHLDCTWNDPVPDVPGRVLYDYYNKTDAEMESTHAWVRENYPACNTPYDMDEHLVDPDPDPDPDIEEVTAAVDSLFDGADLVEGITRYDINAALAMVESLPESAEKEALLVQIDEAYALLDDDVFYGDVTINNQIAVTDAIMVLRYIVGLVDLSTEQKERAKVSGGDGKIAVTDAILILRYIVGLIDGFPADDAA